MSSHAPQRVPADDDFHLFTTFRLDSKLLSDDYHTAACGGEVSGIYLLPHHYNRLKDATATLAGFRTGEILADINSFKRLLGVAVDEFTSKSPANGHQSDGETQSGVVRRGKVSVWPSGHFEVSLVPVPQTFPILLPRSLDDYPDPTWTVIMDVQATETNLYTEIKTSYREAYDRARTSAGLIPTSNKEVLLYNNMNQVMDGTITNVYFYRDNEWVTPDAGGLQGASRRFALDRGLCSIAKSAVDKNSLRSGEVVWLSNAFRGFFPATFSIQ